MLGPKKSFEMALVGGSDKVIEVFSGLSEDLFYILQHFLLEFSQLFIKYTL